MRQIIGRYLHISTSLRLPLRALLLAFVASLIVPNTSAHAQSTYTYTTSGGTNTWTTTANWTGSGNSWLYPGTFSSGINNDIAVFSGTGAAKTMGFSFNNGTTFSLGAINITGSQVNALTFGASNSTAGTLLLNGASVNGIADTIFADFDIASSTSKPVTISGTQNGGMTLALGDSTNNIIQGATGSAMTISANIAGTSKQLTYYGGGNGSTAGGQLFLAGSSNTFTGGITIGKADGSQAGELNIENATALPTTGTITVNTNSGLVLSLTGTYGALGQNLSLNGLGLGVKTDNGAFVVEQVAATWAGNITVNGNTNIDTHKSAALLTVTGTIAGTAADTMQKSGGGTLTLTGANNAAWNTSVTNGLLQVNAGSAIGTGSLTLAQTSNNNDGLQLNNASQQIGNLISSFVASTSQTQVITLNGTILNILESGNTTFGITTATAGQIAAIGGTGGIVLMAGSTGTLTLNGTLNTFSGGTTVAGGTLVLASNNNVLLSTGTVTVSGGTLNITTTSQAVGAFHLTGGTLTGSSGNVALSTGNYDLQAGNISGTLSGSGSIGAIKSNASGTLFVTNINTYGGGTSINAGTVVLSNSTGSALGSGAVTVSGLSSVLASAVTGGVSGNVTVQNGGVLLPGNGASQGVLNIGGALTTQSTGSAFGFTLASGFTDEEVKVTGAMTLGSNAVLNLASTTGFQAGTYTLFTFGSESGTFGTVNNPTNSSFTYQLHYNAGTITLEVDPNATAPRSLLWSAFANPATSGQVTDGGGSWANADNTNKQFWDTNAVAAASWDSTRPDNVTFGNGGAGGTVSLTTDITAGSITFGPVSGGNYTINTNGHTLTIAALVTANSSATLAGSVLISTPETWTVTTSSTLTVSANINESSAGQALTFSGAGTVRLSGANSYSGGTTIAGGTVQINNVNSLGNTSGTATVSAGTLEVTSSFSSGRNFVLNNSGSTILVDSGVTYSMSGTIADGATAGTLNATGPGTLVLSNTANSYSGGTVISGGTVRVDSNGELGNTAGGVTLTSGGTLAVTGSGFTTGRSITLGTGGGVFDIANGGTLIVSTAVSGSGSLTKNDGGTLSLSATGNAFGGGVAVNAGTLAFAQAGSTTFITAPFTVASGATLSMNVATNGTVNFGDGSTPVTETFNGTVVVSGASRLNFNNSTTFTGSGTIQVLTSGMTLSNLSGNAGAAAVTQGIALNPGGPLGSFVTYIGGTTGGGVTLSGVVSGNSSVDFANGSGGGGAGSVYLGATNLWTGTTAFDTKGTVTLGVTNALPTGTAVTFNSAGLTGDTPTLDLNGFSQQVASLATGTTSGTSTITDGMSSTISTLTISGTSGSTTYSGAITDGNGQIAFFKSGSNTQILSGANAYSGGTTVAGGTLVAGSVSAFGGGNVTVSSGGVLAVGNASAVQLSIGSGNLAAYSGSTMSFVLARQAQAARSA